MSDEDERHPWDVGLSFIKRVAGGWQRRPDPYGRKWINVDAPQIRMHPVLFLLFSRAFYDLDRPTRRVRMQLVRDFEEYRVVTDIMLSRIPPPKRWPLSILDRWRTVDADYRDLAPKSDASSDTERGSSLVSPRSGRVKEVDGDRGWAAG